MASQRIEKVNELLKHEVSQFIVREIEFERGTLVTIVRAETDNDLKNTKLFVSVIPESYRARALSLLHAHAPRIQRAMIKRLVMRYVPSCTFYPYEASKDGDADAVEHLLDTIQKELS